MIPPDTLAYIKLEAEKTIEITENTSIEELNAIIVYQQDRINVLRKCILDITQACGDAKSIDQKQFVDLKITLQYKDKLISDLDYAQHMLEIQYEKQIAHIRKVIVAEKKIVQDMSQYVDDMRTVAYCTAGFAILAFMMFAYPASTFLLSFMS